MLRGKATFTQLLNHSLQYISHTGHIYYWNSSPWNQTGTVQIFLKRTFAGVFIREYIFKEITYLFRGLYEKKNWAYAPLIPGNLPLNHSI